MQVNAVGCNEVMGPIALVAPRRGEPCALSLFPLGLGQLEHTHNDFLSSSIVGPGLTIIPVIQRR